VANEGSKERRFRDALAGRWKSALIGGVVFWLPDVLYDYFKRSEPTVAAIWALTFIMPFAVTLAYFVVKSTVQAQTRSLAFSMLLGIWLLAPTMIALGQTFQGVGFRNIYTVAVVIFATVFPPIVLILSGYDLSIMALLAGTVALLLFRRIFEQPTRKPQAIGSVSQAAR
jgi:hypothetical protein